MEEYLADGVIDQRHFCKQDWSFVEPKEEAYQVAAGSSSPNSALSKCKLDRVKVALTKQVGLLPAGRSFRRMREKSRRRTSQR